MTHPLIGAEALGHLLADSPNRVRVFDVRHDLVDHAAGRRAYDAGHIPGAIHIDHETELAAAKTGKNGRHPLPQPEVFAAHMATLGVTPDTHVVAYDASGGMYAAHLWWMLNWIGHRNVQVLDGGWQAWVAAGLTQQTATPADQSLTQPTAQATGRATEHGTGHATKQASHPANEQATQQATEQATDQATQQATQQSTAKVTSFGDGTMEAVDADAVLANIHNPAFTVLDARAAPRYRGEVEPMDPVAGHIPGALNRPNTGNLGEDGRFKSADTLREEYLALLKGVPAEQVVHQCGSGITATHNLLAMEVAGLSGSRLYPGSWSEWVSDSSRPVATGEKP